MVRRNRARYLAPLALAAAIIGTYLVVHNGLTTKASSALTQVRTTGKQTDRRPKSARARFYVVAPGDTLISISVKTGVPVATLEALNRTLVDPNSLQTGQKLRLRR